MGLFKSSGDHQHRSQASNERHGQQQQQQQQQQPPPLQPTAGERAQYAHAGTDWEARNNRDGQADGKDAPKKPSWTKRLFKGPGLGVYGS